MPVLSVVLKVATGAFTGGLGIAGKALGGFGKVVGAAGKMLGAMWHKLKWVALAAVGAFTALTVMAAKFQNQMAFVSTMVKDTNKWMGKLTEGVKQMSIEFAQSTTAMTQALYDILSASVPVEDSMGMLEVASRAAVAGFTDVTAVGKSLTSTMNAMGISFNQAQTVADVMFRVVEKGQLAFQDLQGHMSRALIAAKASRVPFEEVAAAFSFLTRQGMNVAMAETAIAAALDKISAPSEEISKKAKALGIELSATALSTKGLLGVIKDLAKAGLTAEQIKELFPERRAKRAIQAMTGAVQEFEGDIKAMYTAGGAQARAFAKAADTLSFQFKKFISSLKVLFIDLITPMLPALQQLFTRLAALGELLRKDIAGDAAQSIKDFAFKVVDWVENAIYYLLKELPLLFQKIWGYLKFTYAFIREVLDVGIVKWVLSSLWTSITNWYKNLWNVTSNLVKNIGKRVYEGARYAWWQVRSFISGEAIPDFVSEFTDLLDGIKLEWESKMPESFRNGMERIKSDHAKYNAEIERQYKERSKRLDEAREKSHQKTSTGDKNAAETATKLTHKFESEKMAIAKKAAKEIFDERKKEIDNLKALGELSLENELKHWRELLKITVKGTDEMLEAQKKVYELEAELRERRKSEAFEHFDMMEIKERENLKAKIKYMEEFLKREKLSYQQQREAFKELQELKNSLREKELDKLKELNDFYMSELWKRIRAEREELKRQIFNAGKNSQVRNKLIKADNDKARQEAKARWNFIEKLRMRDTKKASLEDLRKLKIAERHAEESIKKDKLTNKEKEAGQKELQKIREEIARAEEDVKKKENLTTKELMEREKKWKEEMEKEFAKVTGKRIDDDLVHEMNAGRKRIEHAKDVKQEVDKITDKAQDKVKELSDAVTDSLGGAIDTVLAKITKLEAALISSIEKIRQLCRLAAECGCLPAPRAEGRIAARGGVQAGAQKGGYRTNEINLGPIYIHKIDSEIDLMDAADAISERISSEVEREFRTI